MTKEQMDQAVKDIHQYFVEKEANYFSVIWILDILKKQYEKKISYKAENMLVSDIAKIQIPKAKERLI